MEYIFIFLEGFASFISPCVMPMLPIYFSYLTGGDTKKGIKNTLGFIIGFSIIFIVLGIFSSSLGLLVTKYMNIIKMIFGFIIIILGLNYMEMLKLNTMNKFNAVKIDLSNLGFLKAILFGIMFAITWTPCVGTFLASALMLVAEKGELLYGIKLLATYSLGLAIPFMVSAIILDKAKKTFKWVKEHYNVIKKISGMLLIILGFYMILK